MATELQTRIGKQAQNFRFYGCGLLPWLNSLQYLLTELCIELCLDPELFNLIFEYIPSLNIVRKNGFLVHLRVDEGIDIALGSHVGDKLEEEWSHVGVQESVCQLVREDVARDFVELLSEKVECQLSYFKHVGSYCLWQVDCLNVFSLLLCVL